MRTVKSGPPHPANLRRDSANKRPDLGHVSLQQLTATRQRARCAVRASHSTSSSIALISTVRDGIRKRFGTLAETEARRFVDRDGMGNNTEDGVDGWCGPLNSYVLRVIVLSTMKLTEPTPR